MMNAHFNTNSVALILTDKVFDQARHIAKYGALLQTSLAPDLYDGVLLLTPLESIIITASNEVVQSFREPRPLDRSARITYAAQMVESLLLCGPAQGSQYIQRERYDVTNAKRALIQEQFSRVDALAPLERMQYLNNRDYKILRSLDQRCYLDLEGWSDLTFAYYFHEIVRGYCEGLANCDPNQILFNVKRLQKFVDDRKFSVLRKETACRLEEQRQIGWGEYLK